LARTFVATYSASSS